MSTSTKPALSRTSSGTAPPSVRKESPSPTKPETKTTPSASEDASTKKSTSTKESTAETTVPSGKSGSKPASEGERELTASPESKSGEIASGDEKDESSIIDMDTFSQILEMDEDEDDREFSQSIVDNFFTQAEDTFIKMDKAIEEEDLPELSRLGHYFKGSSAALGVHRVQASCERIQHYGHKRDEEKSMDLTAEVSMKKIKDLYPKLKADYAEAEIWLKDYYGES